MEAGNKKNLNTMMDLYFIFCKWASPNMQEIIKEACLSRQLFKTVNFAFMKCFDFLIKTVL